MANLILVEGPDNSGKTTIINELIKRGGILLDFPKRTSEGLFKCESRNEIAIFTTMLNHLKTEWYILDRSYISNMVYEGIRGNKIDHYIDDFNQLCKNHEVFVVPLIRNYIDEDFKDDNIILDKKQFNDVIDSYVSVYSLLNLVPIKYLSHDHSNKVISSEKLNTFVDEWIEANCYG